MGNPFATLLSDIKSTDDKAKLETLSPETREILTQGVMRQSDYNKVKDEHRKLADAATKWVPWNQNERPEWERRYVGYEEQKRLAEQRQTELSRIQGELEALKATRTDENGQVITDPSKLAEAVAKILEPALKGQFVTKAEGEDLVKRSWNDTATKLLPTALAAERMAAKYREEFGVPVDPEVFLKAAAESGLSDAPKALDYAYATVSGPKREEQSKKKHEEDIAKAREEGRISGLREQQSANVPPGMESGHQFPFLTSTPREAVPEANLELGNPALATLAGDELAKLSTGRAT